MPETKAQLESQTDPRCVARIAIFHGPYHKEILTDYSINISTGGVFIESRMVLPVDSKVMIKFILPDSNTMVVTKARVAWVNEPHSLKKASLPPGMGLQFLDLFFRHYAEYPGFSIQR